MQYRKEINFNNNNPFSSIIGIVLGILLLLGLFFIARFIFTILYYLSPLFLIAALVIDYKVVLGYGKWVVGLVKRNALLGAGAILLSVLGFPLLTVFLLGKALLKRQMKQAQREAEEQQVGDYIEYEELDSDSLDLPQIDREEPLPKDSNRYDDFFKEE